MPHRTESSHAFAYMAYAGPAELARDKRLTREHRRMVLRRWLHDVRDRLAQRRRNSDDSAVDDSRDITLMARINQALRGLRG